MIAYFVRHPVAANLLMIAGLFLGAISISGIERESLPAFAASSVNVTVTYSGATARDVDEEICIPLDNALNTLDSLDEFTCVSKEGAATATLEMVEGGDISQFYNDIVSDVSTISDFPLEADEPSITMGGRTEMVALLAVTGLDGDEALLRYADDLSDRLGNLRGVATAEVSGISDLEYRVRLDESALRKYGLSSNDVSAAVNERSLQAPLGDVETDGRDIAVRIQDSRRSTSALEDLIVVQNENGGLVRLGDIATISLVPLDSADRANIDGERAAIISINKTKTDDAITAFRAVSTFLENERALYPNGLQITVINNLTEEISNQIDLVVSNAMQSLLLVLIVMCLFFSISDAFWISMALPFSFLASFWAMNSLGVTINMMTLLALLMAIGLIMDDSIVIAENIAKWREKAPPGEAAVRGVQEVMGGVASSFLSTAGVFVPLMFLSGKIGQVLQVVPVVLLITLSVSLLEAFFILPHHLSRKRGSEKEMSRRVADRVIDFCRDYLIIPVVKRLIVVRYLTVGLSIAALIVSIGLVTSGVIKIIGFPETEGDTIVGRIALTPGTQLERTEEVVQQMIAGIESVDAEFSPNTINQAPLVERVLVQYSNNNDVKDNGAHTATVTVDLLEADLRNIPADAVAVAWKEATGPIADLVQSNFLQSSMGPGGNDINLKLYSRDLDQLEGASQAFLNGLAARADVTSVYRDFSRGKSEFRLALNVYGYTLGLTPQELATQLRSAFTGSETDSFREELSTFKVRIQLGSTIANVADLEAFPITLNNGAQVALSRVADFTETATYTQITRENGFMRAQIIGQIDDAATTAGDIARYARTGLAEQILVDFPNVFLTSGGASAEQAETQSSIGVALLSGLLFIYLVLSLQFRSYALPLVIMIAIPFALIGVILGHYVLGISLSMPSFIGFASLAGVVVNNAILFVDFFEKHVENGDYEAAAIEAVRQRFRPVFLSSTTTFVGLLPVVFETSIAAQTIVPVVVSVAFGLLASMLLVIFVFPSIIGIYFDFMDVNKWARGELSSEGTESVAIITSPRTG